MRARELREQGWPPDAAWREASRQFGDVDATAEYCARLDEEKEHRMRWRQYVRELWQDLTYGVRMLHRVPGHSAVALLTIAIGVGATTVVFSLVHASLLAPLPYAHADRLHVVRVSLPDYADLRGSTAAFEDSGVYASNLYMMDDEQILGGVVSPGFFRTLGVAPILGRTIEERDGAAPVAVLSHRLWQRRFGRDVNVIGRSITLGTMSHTVIGVMPATFQFPSRQFQVWASMDAAMTVVPQQSTNRALRIFSMVGRLRPGVTPSQAQAQLSSLAARLAAMHPDTNADIPLTLVSIEERLVGNVRTALLVALGSVACLLFIACANVASLTLARLTTRTQELAMRAALGAGRWRIARQLVTESLLIAVCGGVLGVLLARLGLAALPVLIGDRVPRVEEVALSFPVLLVSIGTMLLAGLLVAAVPMVQLSMTGIESALKTGPRGGEPRAGIRLRSALVVAQIAVAVVVVSGALVLSRSLARLLTADPGFSSDRLLAFHLLLLEQPSSGARAVAAARTLEAIAGIPGVEESGGATGLAPMTAQRGTTFDVERHAGTPAAQRRAYFVAASPGYFRTLGTRLLAGREFIASDTDTSPRVVIVSEALARRFFPDGDAVGRRLRLLNPEQSNEWRTIVGVVANIRYQGLDDVDPPVVFTPFAQTPFPWIYVHVRAHTDPMALVGSIRRAVTSVDSRLTVANPQPMAALISESSADPRFRTTLVSLFAAIALLLAAIGLHGVVAFAVVRRTRETAIRLALGASGASVRRRVIGQALGLAAAGVGLGLAGALLTGGVLSGLLYEIGPSDPVSLGLVSAMLLVTALLASLVPARRATRIQPVDALREA
jgi:predicted permease